MATLVTNSTQAVKKLVSSQLLAKDAFGLAKTQRNLFGLLQQTLAAAVVVFYSKNLLSAAIRAFISV